MNEYMVGLVRDAYLHALALDAGNRPAAFNLAVLDLHTGRGDPMRHLDLLRDLRDSCRRPPGAGVVSDTVNRLRDRLAGVRGVEADPMWWHTTYALAAGLAHRGVELGDDAIEDPRGEASGIARNGLLAGLRVLGRRTLWRTPIAAFVADATPAIAVLYAGLTARQIDPTVTPPRSPKAVRALARQLRAYILAGDAALYGSEIVALVRGLPGQPTPRTRYNLACLFAQFGMWQPAVDEFEAAVTGLDGEMLAWAINDPTLRPIADTVSELVYVEMRRRDELKAAALPAERPEPQTT